MDQLINQLPQLQAKVEHYPNVVGSGLGVKWVDGLPTNEPAIIVFVQEKIDLENEFFAQSANTIVPSEIDGVKTDIISVGNLIPHVTAQLDTQDKEYYKKKRPLTPGYSTAHGAVTAGTLGGFFLDKDGDLVILSNSHVLAHEGKGKAGDLIFQPGPADGNPPVSFTGWDQPMADIPYVASLKDFEPFGTANTQDSAIAKIPHELFAAGMVNPIYPKMNKPIGNTTDATVGLSLQKVGRTTGYTVGNVLAMGASFTIQYECGAVKFDNVIVTSAMSAPGDSGSVVFDTDMNMVGLLFAGSAKVTLLNPIKPVLDRYGLTPYRGGPIIQSYAATNGWIASINTKDSIKRDGNSVLINAKGNEYAFIEKIVHGITKVSATINTGTDTGRLLGPGIVVRYQEGFIKLNLRHHCCYGFTMNDQEYHNIGRVKPNSSYDLSIEEVHDKIIGKISTEGREAEVFNIPKSLFPSKANKVRIGKAGTSGGAFNGQELGEVGQCVLSNINILDAV
jgi:hypothetical protein